MHSHPAVSMAAAAAGSRDFIPPNNQAQLWQALRQDTVHRILFFLLGSHKDLARLAQVSKFMRDNVYLFYNNMLTPEGHTKQQASFLSIPQFYLINEEDRALSAIERLDRAQVNALEWAYAREKQRAAAQAATQAQIEAVIMHRVSSLTSEQISHLKTPLVTNLVSIRKLTIEEAIARTTPDQLARIEHQLEDSISLEVPPEGVSALAQRIKGFVINLGLSIEQAIKWRDYLQSISMNSTMNANLCSLFYIAAAKNISHASLYPLKDVIKQIQLDISASLIFLFLDFGISTTDFILNFKPNHYGRIPLLFNTKLLQWLMLEANIYLTFPLLDKSFFSLYYDEEKSLGSLKKLLINFYYKFGISPTKLITITTQSYHSPLLPLFQFSENSLILIELISKFEQLKELTNKYDYFTFKNYLEKIKNHEEPHSCTLYFFKKSNTTIVLPLMTRESLLKELRELITTEKNELNPSIKSFTAFLHKKNKKKNKITILEELLALLSDVNTPGAKVLTFIRATQLLYPEYRANDRTMVLLEKVRQHLLPSSNTAAVVIPAAAAAAVS